MHQFDDAISITVVCYTSRYNTLESSVPFVFFSLCEEAPLRPAVLVKLLIEKAAYGGVSSGEDVDSSRKLAAGVSLAN